MSKKKKEKLYIEPYFTIDANIVFNYPASEKELKIPIEVLKKQITDQINQTLLESLHIEPLLYKINVVSTNIRSKKHAEEESN